MLRNFNSYYLNCRGRYAIRLFILVFPRLEVFGFKVIISWFAYRDNLWQQECYRKTTLDTIYRSACSNVKSDIWPILWQLCRQRNLDEWQKKCLFLYGFAERPDFPLLTGGSSKCSLAQWIDMVSIPLHWCFVWQQFVVFSIYASWW